MKEEIKMGNKYKQTLITLTAIVLITSIAATFNVLNAPQAYAETPSVLVTGANGASKNFTLTELEAMPNVTMDGGFYQTKQGIVNNGLWTGVSLLYLCNQVGGITPDSTVTVTGQGTTQFTYDMVNSGTNFNLEYATYNNVTGAVQNQTQPVTIILAYQVNGTSLPSSSQPAPRLVIVGPEGLLCDGSGGRSITQVNVNSTTPISASPSSSPPASNSTSATTSSPSPTATAESKGSNLTTVYLIAAIAVVIIIVVAAFVLSRRK